MRVAGETMPKETGSNVQTSSSAIKSATAAHSVERNFQLAFQRSSNKSRQHWKSTQGERLKALSKIQLNYGGVLSMKAVGEATGGTSNESAVSSTNSTNVIYLVKMNVSLPLSQVEFNSTLQAKFKQSIAIAAGIAAYRVTIDDITKDAITTPRRRLLAVRTSHITSSSTTITRTSSTSSSSSSAPSPTRTATSPSYSSTNDKIRVDFSVRARHKSMADSIVAKLTGKILNLELVKHDLPNATVIEGPSIVDVSRPAEHECHADECCKMRRFKLDNEHALADLLAHQEEISSESPAEGSGSGFGNTTKVDGVSHATETSNDSDGGSNSTLTSGDSGAANTTETSVVRMANIEKQTAFNDLGGSKSQFLDRHNVVCLPNAISGFKLERNEEQMRYIYNCAQGVTWEPVVDAVTGSFVSSTAENDGGGGRMEYLDRHNVECPAGTAIAQFKLNSKNDANQISYSYNCIAPAVQNKMVCHDKSTSPTIADGFGFKTEYLDRQLVKCEDNQVMQRFQMVSNMAANSLLYEYRCCNVQLVPADAPGEDNHTGTSVDIINEPAETAAKAPCAEGFEEMAGRADEMPGRYGSRVYCGVAFDDMDMYADNCSQCNSQSPSVCQGDCAWNTTIYVSSYYLLYTSIYVFSY